MPTIFIAFTGTCVIYTLSSVIIILVVLLFNLFNAEICQNVFVFNVMK